MRGPSTGRREAAASRKVRAGGPATAGHRAAEGGLPPRPAPRQTPPPVPPRPLLSHDLHRRLCRARDLVHAHALEPFSLGDAAREARLSRAHFLRLFRRAFGETPHAYRTRLRLDRAKALLARGDLPVTEVCLEVGYESLGSFSTLFTARVGQSPAAWRRAMRPLVQVPRAWARLTVPCCYQGLWF